MAGKHATQTRYNGHSNKALEVSVRALPIILLLIASLCACEQKKPAKRQAGQFRSNGGGLQNTVDTKSVVKERLLEQEAKKALQRFQIKYGRNPTDIDELLEKTEPPLKELPSDYDYVYDPATGKVTVE